MHDFTSADRRSLGIHTSRSSSRATLYKYIARKCLRLFNARLMLIIISFIYYQYLKLTICFRNILQDLQNQNTIYITFRFKEIALISYQLTKIVLYFIVPPAGVPAHSSGSSTGTPQFWYYQYPNVWHLSSILPFQYQLVHL